MISYTISSLSAFTRRRDNVTAAFIYVRMSRGVRRGFGPIGSQLQGQHSPTNQKPPNVIGRWNRKRRLPLVPMYASIQEVTYLDVSSEYFCASNRKKKFQTVSACFFMPNNHLLLLLIVSALPVTTTGEIWGKAREKYITQQHFRFSGIASKDVNSFCKKNTKIMWIKSLYQRKLKISGLAMSYILLHSVWSLYLKFLATIYYDNLQLSA